MKRLDRFVRGVEARYRPRADFDAVMAHGRDISPSLGGRTVFDDVKPHTGRVARRGQLELFPD